MYKELLLDNSKIEQAIKNFFKIDYNNIKVIPEDKPNKSGFIETRYNVEFDNQKLFLTVFINSKGKTTLKVKEGKLQEIKLYLAEYIKEHCKIDNNLAINNQSMLFKTIDFSDFEKTIKFINAEELCKEIRISKEDINEKIYKLKGSYNDIVTITFNKKTNNVRVQGIPLLLYNLCVSYMNELLSVDEVVNNLEENLGKSVSSLSIEEQYKSYLPNSYNKHSEKLRKSLLKAVYNLNVTSQEYTCTELVFEVLRALEGHIKLTLYRDYQVTSSKQYGNLDMFNYDYNRERASIKKDVRNKILSIKDRVEYYKKAYKHIVVYRHKYFHWDFPNDFGNDETVQIDDVDVAKKLIKDTLKIIDEYYEI